MLKSFRGHEMPLTWLWYCEPDVISETDEASFQFLAMPFERVMIC